MIAFMSYSRVSQLLFWFCKTTSTNNTFVTMPQYIDETFGLCSRTILEKYLYTNECNYVLCGSLNQIVQQVAWQSYDKSEKSHKIYRTKGKSYKVNSTAQHIWLQQLSFNQFEYDRFWLLEHFYISTSTFVKTRPNIELWS